MMSSLVVMAVVASDAVAWEAGSPGSGAGQFSEIGGIAWSAFNGDVYAVDKIGNHRVQAFSRQGAFLRAWGWGVLEPSTPGLQVCTTTCFGGVAGTGVGQFGSDTRGIAVDNFKTGGSFGDVYVVDQANDRVQKFGPEGEFELVFGREVNKTRKTNVCTAREIESEGVECQSGMAGSGEAEFEFASRGEPIAVGGQSGDVYVASRGRVEVFSEEGAFLRSMAMESKSAVALGEIEAIAVSPAGDVYVIAEGEPRVLEYEETLGMLSLLHELNTTEAEAVTFDETTSTLFVEVEGRTSDRHVDRFAQTGARSELFAVGGSASFEPLGMTWDAERGEVYFGLLPGVLRGVVVPGPGPFVVSRAVEGAGPGCVKFTASVDPEGATSSVWFEYEVAPGNFEKTGVQTLPGEQGGEPNFGEEAAEATVCKLAAGKTFAYRVVAENANGRSEPAGSFTTPPAAIVAGESVSAVSSQSATLQAQLNPLGTATSWWFEYAPQGSGSYTRTQVGTVAAVTEDVAVSAHLDGLSPHTTYDFRLVAENVLAEGESLVRGSLQSFTTQRAGAVLRLPDGRQWEQVSPAQKQDVAFEAMPYNGGLIQAAAGGEAIAYLARSSTEAQPEGLPAPEFSQLLSRHVSDAWQTRDIASRHEQEWGVIEGHYSEFYAFSNDLSVGLVEPQGETLLGGASERTPYLRTQGLCESEPAPAGGCYLPLVNSQDVTSGEKWGGSPGSTYGEVEYAAASASLEHVVVESQVPLLAGAAGRGVYEWSAGRLSLVSVLPAGTQAAGCAGIRHTRPRHVVSGDGDRVVWEDPCEGRHLYMREGASGRTVQLDQGATGAFQAEFQDASADGSRVFFTDEERLTPESLAAGGAPDLYVFEANPDSDPNAGVVRDVTVPVHTGESAGVLDTIPGVSADGSVAYVVATGLLSAAANEYGATAVAGQPNLYRVQRVESGGEAKWEASFIATLSQQDYQDWSGEGFGLAHLTAGVSANGRWLAFMSERPLTGYDNRDVASGQADEEVFLYDGGSGRLVCASCDPSGARPRGIERIGGGEGTQPLIDSQRVWRGRWLAGVIPAWDTRELLEGVYEPRFLSDSGRLFFDSTDALVPQDANRTADVYEYEPAGVGSCTEAQETYSAGQSGCIGLVSSGTSPEESVFLDASESGDDVFFLTAAKLLSQDADSAYDVYDAHVCAVGWECPASSAAAPAPCDSSPSCKAPTAAGAAGALPGSATFEGAGNLTAHRKGSAGRANRRVLERALERCRRLYRRDRRRRRSCERRVRSGHPLRHGRHRGRGR